MATKPKAKAALLGPVSTIEGARPMSGTHEYVGLERRTRVILVLGPGNVTIEYKLGDAWLVHRVIPGGVHEVYLCPLPFRIIADEATSFAID